jgi:hypothetical protein
MPVKCENCGEDIFKMNRFHHWARLMNFMDFLYLNGQISETLYETITNDLMAFKEFALDESEKDDKIAIEDKVRKDYIGRLDMTLKHETRNCQKLNTKKKLKSKEKK